MKELLFYIELGEDENFSEYLKFLNFLTPEKQMRIHKFKFAIDKKLSLFSDLFVRYFACKVLNLSNSDLFFGKNAYGKPYLVDYPDFNYSISHTKNAIAIGFSEISIGVDIERIKPSDMKIAERFFCKNEFEYIVSKEDQERLFCEVWTKKEAYIKWIGKGLSLSLTAFDITDIEIANMFRTIKIDNYLISVCSKNRLNKMDINELSEREVFQIFTEFTSSSGQ